MKSMHQRGGTWAVLFIAAAIGGASMTAYANEQERQEILGRIQQVVTKPEAYKAAIVAGKERSVLCGYCHGVDGNSTKPDIPNLAGQNPAYLLQQVEKFADGRRINFVMQNLAKEFTMEDKVNLSLYYASQKVRQEEADAELAAKGRELFSHTCQRCHGIDGHGEEGYARIAGQRQQYVQTTLKRFRENARNKKANLSVDEVKRSNESMEMYTQFLSDDDIEALAAHIATLRPASL